MTVVKLKPKSDGPSYTRGSSAVSGAIGQSKWTVSVAVYISQAHLGLRNEVTSMARYKGWRKKLRPGLEEPCPGFLVLSGCCCLSPPPLCKEKSVNLRMKEVV